MQSLVQSNLGNVRLSILYPLHQPAAQYPPQTVQMRIMIDLFESCGLSILVNYRASWLRAHSGDLRTGRRGMRH